MNIRKYYLKFIESAQDRSIISKLCAEANIKEDKLRNELNRYNKANPNVEERLKFEKVKNSLMEKAKPVDNSRYFDLIFKILNSKDPKETITLIEESEIKEEQKFFAVVTSYVVAISKNNKIKYQQYL